MTTQRPVDRSEKDKIVRDIKARVCTATCTEFSDLAVAVLMRRLQKQNKEGLARQLLRSYFSRHPEAWDRLMRRTYGPHPASTSQGDVPVGAGGER